MVKSPRGETFGGEKIGGEHRGGNFRVGKTLEPALIDECKSNIYFSMLSAADKKNRLSQLNC